jgi:hypothetical protein
VDESSISQYVQVPEIDPNIDKVAQPRHGILVINGLKIMPLALIDLRQEIGSEG